MGRSNKSKYNIYKDLRFGRLVVIGKHPIKKYFIDCICDCGQIISTNRYNLINNHTKSCGCLSTENRSLIGKSNVIDITGKTFGFLTAIKRTSKPGEYKAVKWLFLCKCGKEKIISGNYVTTGQIVSCGCAAGKIVRPKHIRERWNAYQKNRRKADLKYHILCKIGNAIRKSLIKTKSKKIAHWEKLLEFSTNELIVHLSKTMPKGYSWEDYHNGKLHIDHIKPLASFNYSSINDPEFKRAWSINNLQLLTAEDNMRKHDKY